jgi:hypothetical protein
MILLVKMMRVQWRAAEGSTLEAQRYKELGNG